MPVPKPTRRRSLYDIGEGRSKCIYIEPDVQDTAVLLAFYVFIVLIIVYVFWMDKLDSRYQANTKAANLKAANSQSATDEDSQS
jgi:hypothetical protein